MKALEELTRDIREKLPRLMELSEGCVFCYPTSKDINYIVTQEEIEMISFNRVETFSQPRVEYKSVIRETRLIIGKEPMLNDVMQYLWKLVEEDHENQDEILFGIGCLTNAYDNFCWNFKNPYLKDQSPELIAFLHGLIEK